MANQVLNFSDLKGAIDLYNALPAATLFRGLTGYGLVLNSDGQEIIAEVSSAKAIWKPMYLVISGGKKHGREKLSAEMIQLCLEEFAKNPLWALLKSTSGFGLRLGDGMVELVEAQQATTPINFEISHFGGRSILLTLSVSLGKVVSQEIEWKGGFSYQNDHNRPTKAGDSLVLNRLMSDDLEVERILSDVVREANRLSMMNTDGTLMNTDGTLPPHIHNGTAAPAMQIFLRQELTALVPGAQLERQIGFDYTIRQDGVEIQKRIALFQLRTAEKFEQVFADFRKECARVQMLYCQPLSENQKQKAGKPSNEIFGPADIQWISWQSANRGDGVIAFHPRAERRHDAVFPTEGWNPKEDERHRVLCVRRGNGFSGFPAPPAYIKRYVQKDERMASLQFILVNFDGREKVLSEEDVSLSERRVWEDGRYFSARGEIMPDGIWIVEQKNGIWRLCQDKVRETGNSDINGKPITEISYYVKETITCPAERRFKPEKIYLRPKSYDYYAGNLDPNLPDGWKIYAKGKNPDGQEVTASVNKDGLSDVPWGWEEIPEAIRQQHLAKWPVCSCGRQRYEMAKYDRCELCRDYRPCASCGKETRFGAVTIESGSPLYCPDCRREWVDNWELADQHITSEQREQIVAEATVLLSGEVITGEEANTLLIGKGWTGAYFVILIGNEYRVSPFSMDELQVIATLPDQSPKEFLRTVEMITARRDPREDNFYRAVHDFAYGSGENILSDFLAEVPVEPVEEQFPEIPAVSLVAEAPAIIEESPAKVAISTEFLYSGGRDFQCPKCGCFQRITKSELKAYQAGEKVKITCVCGYSDFVQTEACNNAEAKANGDNRTLDLTRLAQAWSGNCSVRIAPPKKSR